LLINLLSMKVYKFKYEGLIANIKYDDDCLYYSVFSAIL